MCYNVLLLLCVSTVEAHLRESWRSDGDGSVRPRREDERLRYQQIGFVEARTWHCVLPPDTVTLAERLHTGILSRSKVDELLLHSS